MAASPAQQISLFFGRDYLIKFQQCRQPIPSSRFVSGLRNAGGRFRQHGVDYLLYTLLDLVVDAGFPLFERFGETLEDLEAELLDKPIKPPSIASIS